MASVQSKEPLPQCQYFPTTCRAGIYVNDGASVAAQQARNPGRHWRLWLQMTWRDKQTDGRRRHCMYKDHLITIGCLYLKAFKGFLRNLLRSRKQMLVPLLVCRIEESPPDSSCDALSTPSTLTSHIRPPQSCRLIMKAQQGDIVRNSFRRRWLKRLNFLFSNTPLPLSHPCHGTQGCHYSGGRPHPFIILLTYETKHIYIKYSYLPSSLNHTVFCCV